MTYLHISNCYGFMYCSEIPFPIALLFILGFWSELLGVGDLYYELGVQVVELCVATAHLNGGMLPMADAIKRLNGRRARKNNPIAE